MKTHPGVKTDNEVNRNFSLRVYISEKKEGLFVLKLVGSINTITSLSLQNEIEKILDKKGM